MTFDLYTVEGLHQALAALSEVFRRGRLDDFTHNKAIQKCRESLRVSKEDKAMLQTLKRKKK